MTVAELIENLGGELLQGDPAILLTGVSNILRASAKELVFADTEASVSNALESKAAAAVVPSNYIPLQVSNVVLIAAGQPRLWFAQAARLMSAPLLNTGIDRSAVVAADALIHDGASVAAGAIIGNLVTIGAHSRIEAGAIIGDRVTVGANCRIYPRAVLYPGITLGDRVVVHAGAILGADGFGYVRDQTSGAYTQFPQQGELVIEDDVEIGANSTIDRGALSETRIRRGAKFDNLVHIGHNCDIGEDVVIASQTGISGSCKVGNGAILAGQVGIGDHAEIGSNVILGGQAGVLPNKNLTTTGTVLWGTPAKPLREYLRELATLSRISKRKKE